MSQEASDVQSLQTSLCSEHQTVLSIINGTTSLQPKSYMQPIHRGHKFSVQDLELLHKFSTRTILTLGTPRARLIYQKAYTKLAYSVRLVSLYFSQSLIESASIFDACCVDIDNNA